MANTDDAFQVFVKGRSDPHCSSRFQRSTVVFASLSEARRVKVSSQSLAREQDKVVDRITHVSVVGEREVRRLAKCF